MRLFSEEVILQINILWAITTQLVPGFGLVPPLHRPQESVAMSLPQFYLRNPYLLLLKPQHHLISRPVRLGLIFIWFTEQHHLLPIHQPSLAKVQAHPRL
jgi:hypothetical protein